MGSVHFSSLIISRFSAQHSGSSALLLANLLVAVRRARTRVCCIPSAPSPIAGYASILPCLTPPRERERQGPRSSCVVLLPTLPHPPSPPSTQHSTSASPPSLFLSPSRPPHLTSPRSLPLSASASASPPLPAVLPPRLDCSSLPHPKSGTGVETGTESILQTPTQFPRHPSTCRHVRRHRPRACPHRRLGRPGPGCHQARTAGRSYCLVRWQCERHHRRCRCCVHLITQ